MDLPEISRNAKALVSGNNNSPSNHKLVNQQRTPRPILQGSSYLLMSHKKAAETLSHNHRDLGGFDRWKSC
ncbi:hypothetical protein PGT21_013806 [Puccinia graminis f. sp. tritici]|uniref:Uncharacterized protein n=1 Tax=Puccinia graminis f. sp. tritici TaxID=56615 RepID=A0A5B0N396_PUCGR|nr:hypothetical protein PGTUg99_025119 [Puccinia graminis f. sp. tritici]KAA1094219.1 hypothetical protein PGT21_013806 [Puccinia graminis f. sp. tritici]